MIKTEFYFNDGNGLVKAHQHENGGGWVADSATVAKTAFVGINAQVYGNAEVYGKAHVQKSPINIIGIEYNITIYADFAQVGCKLRKIEDWKKFSAYEITQMDGKKATEFYPKLLKLFEVLGV